MSFYRSLWVFIGRSLCVLMDPLGVLLVYMRLYVSLRVLRGPYASYRSLRVFIGPFAFLWVLISPHASL